MSIHPAIDAPEHRPEPHGLRPPADVLAVLDRAVVRGIIEQAQAEAIARAEGLGDTPASPLPGESRVRALVAEALGYVGAVLAVVSAIMVVQRFWDDLRPWSRVTLLAVVVAVLTVAGAFIRRERTGAIGRLGSFLWFLASGAMAGTAALTSVELLDLEGAAVAALTGAATTIFSAGLWSVRRASLQQLATFAGLLLAAVGSLALLDVALANFAGLVVWAIAVAWLSLAHAELIQPLPTAYVLGAVGAVAGPFVAAPGDGGWVLWIGLATAGVLVAASVPLRRTVLLGIGTAGLFVYVPRIVFTFFGEALGPPVALFVTGVVLIVIALSLTRLRPRTLEPGRAVHRSSARVGPRESRRLPTGPRRGR